MMNRTNRVVFFALLISAVVICISGQAIAKKPPTGGGGDVPVGLDVPPGWPSWPLATNEGPFFDLGPYSFTYLNRDVYPYVEYVSPSPQVYSDALDIWGGQTGVPIWGSRIKYIWTDSSVPVETGFPDERKIYLGYKNNPKDFNLVDEENSTIVEELEANAVIPRFIPSESNDPEWNMIDASSNEMDNEYFPTPWVGAWVDFLSGNSKSGQYMADSGHCYPLMVWPDNVWISRMGGGKTYMKQLESAYLGWGGKITFMQSNEGLLHAFPVDDHDQAEKWSLIPMPAFQIAAYQEFLKQVSDNDQNQTSGERGTRLTLLDGPVSFADVEADSSESSTSWRRVFVGTTGVGNWMRDKHQGIWALQGHALTDTYSRRGDNLGIGAYALDVTTPDSPKELWSFFSDGANLSLSGNLENASSVTETALKDVWELCARPILGYVVDGNGSRKWMVLLAGIDRARNYHLWALDAIDGSVEHSISIASRDDADLVDDDIEDILPTRIAAVLPPEDDFPSGAPTYSPLLSEVYLHFSDGRLFLWDLQTDPDSPKDLINFRFKLQGDYYGSPATQDFDATFLEVGGQLHRFIAIPLLIDKEGLGTGGGLRNALLVLDITKLYQNVEEEDLPYAITVEASWGEVNSIEVAKTDPEGIAKNIYLAIHSQFDTLTPISAPVFYDGSLLFATTGEEAKNPGTWNTLFYHVDPLAEINDDVTTYGDAIGAGKNDVSPLPGRAVGGAFIDTNGVIRAPVLDGSGNTAVSSADFGLDPMGTGAGEGEIDDEVKRRIQVLYWRVLN